MNYLQQHLNLNQPPKREPWTPPARKRLKRKVQGLRLKHDLELEEQANDIANKLDTVFIYHQQAQLIFDKGIQLIIRCGTTTTPGGGFITAPTQSGKSAICYKLQQLLPREDEDGIEQVPVLYISCGSGVNSKNLATVMLRALNYPFSKNLDAESLGEHLARALTTHGVRLIIIDEANHISEGGAVASRMDAADLVPGQAPKPSSKGRSRKVGRAPESGAGRNHHQAFAGNHQGVADRVA